LSVFEQLDPSRFDLPERWSERILSPALVVYLDHVRANIARVIELSGGDPLRWRPHVKTLKIPEVLVELVRAGVRGFKCATTREADHLARALTAEHVAGGDVLVAYSLIGPALERLAAIARKRTETRFSVLCEDPRAVDEVPDELDIFVDVNPGMDRSGVPLDDRRRVIAIARRAGRRFRGVHAYDGHLLDADPAVREAAVFRCYDDVLELLRALDDSGIRVPEVVTAGTPSFPHAVAYRRFDEIDGLVHRFSPGTVVYHDVRSEEQNPGSGLIPAVVVFSRVVSHPCDDIVTCDAGSKAIAVDAGDPCAEILRYPGLRALRPSEEHLPLRVIDGSRPERGCGLMLIPRHVCPTVNLAEEALIVEGGEVRSIVPVSARAHETWLGPAGQSGTTSDAT